MATLEDQLAEIEAMDKANLKDRWASLTGQEVPKISTTMLRLALAWELQAQTLGGLPRNIVRQLDGDVAQKAIATDIRPGMRLAREHGGKVHVVTIGENSEIIWNNREWRSLSEVARAITGTRWSGPAFFWLRKAA